jgi:hypothetical protein
MYLHQSIPSSERATVVSFDSLVGSIGGSTGLGYLSPVQSVPFGFAVGGAATLLVVPILGRLGALNEPADRIVPDPDSVSAPAAVIEPAESSPPSQLEARRQPRRVCTYAHLCSFCLVIHPTAGWRAGHRTISKQSDYA